MSLQPGTRVGPYAITAQIGVGGMGEVYRATDTNLGRDVAIKVLPEAFAQDAERLARFDREARPLASLNHPNIAAIYGLEKSDGTTALVMELVEGPTLADRIAQGAIPIDEALPIAKQIAEALEAAHEQGIIHRDLKPANVKVRPDGTVKVLDFGLAKAMEPAGAMSPTITTPAMTQAGMILGTAAYMSPEQARGGAADRRVDIWAYTGVCFSKCSQDAVCSTGRRYRTSWRRCSAQNQTGQAFRRTCILDCVCCSSAASRRIREIGITILPMLVWIPRAFLRIRKVRCPCLPSWRTRVSRGGYAQLLRSLW